MTLRAGDRVGPYEVVSALGAGGMGEVYRARDSRLGRDVAVKVLPAQFASDPELRRRFDREARAISSLSHPHVCALFDIGHSGGIDYLVMEYLDGETLAARLTRGPLPLDQVVRYGIEIASALAAAHRKGVVHRDLKPGNIMLTRSGARLLDFGLAKPAGPAPGVGVEATVSAPITTHGTLVGTYPYMAPEQLEGREADARSDIFAFGAVLYEMATGIRAFEGKTAASLIAAILERTPPPVSARQPLAPAALDDIIRGCLAKDPDDRWQTAHDVKLQLEGLKRQLADAGATDVVAAPAHAGRRRIAWAVSALAFAGVAIAALVLWPQRQPQTSESTQAVRAWLPPPRSHSFTPHDFAVSPDGRQVAFVAAGSDGVSALWSWQVDSPEPLRIASTEGAIAPFWSPDSRRIAYFTAAKLMKVDSGGGGMQEICNVGLTTGGGTWSEGDVIVYAQSVIGPLLKVSANGGEPAPVTRVPADMPGEAHRFPQFLPGGTRFLYVASWTNQQRGGLYLGDIDGSPPQLVSSEIRSRIVLAGSHLLYADGGTLYARPFDVQLGRVTGDARPLLRNEVFAHWRFGEVPVSASPGLLVYQSRLTYNSQLVRYDRSGRELGPVGEPGFASPALSPDGQRVAVGYDRQGTGEWDTTILDMKRHVHYPLPRTGTHTAQVWSPDGRWIYYSAIRAGTNGIYRRRADASGAEETMLESPAHLLVNAHAPDAQRFLFMDFSTGNPELREFDVEKRATRVVAPGAEGVYSPDGQWIAYLGFPTGLVLTRTNGQGENVHVLGRTGSQVRWRSDMKELFYIAADKQLMSVPLTVRNGTIEPGIPTALFVTRIVQPRLVLFQYDTIDGKEFLINSLPREDAAAPLTLLVNWKAAIR